MQADGSCRCCASSAVMWLSLLAGLYAMRWVIKTSIRAALSLDGADELSRATAAVSKIGVNYMQTTALLSGFDLDWGRASATPSRPWASAAAPWCMWSRCSASLTSTTRAARSSA